MAARLAGEADHRREVLRQMDVDAYDAIVVGSGQAGGPLAIALAGAGKRVALIEQEHVGGCCVNEGCTPTKTMIASGRVAYLAARAGDYGVRASQPAVDVEVVRQRKRDVVDTFRNGSQRRLENTRGLELLFGKARFSAAKSLDVALRDGGSRSVAAPLIFINTGARPRTLEVEGSASLPVLTSTTVMELDRAPEHLLVVGGGYIGVEFAQLFRRLGSRVTVIQRSPRLLPIEDADISGAVLEVFHQDGIEVLLEARPIRASGGPGHLELTVEGPGGERRVSGSHLLAAAGRQPNSDSLNLEAAGIAVDDRGYIPVNERLETGVPGIYALGDVKGGPAFTHISYDDFRIIRANVLEGGDRRTGERPVPYCVFMDPELGRVGLTEAGARKAGRDVQVFTMPMSSVARAIETAETRGLMKAVVEATTGQILGFAVLGIAGGELMSLVEVAMMGKLPYTALRDAVFAHPTVSEALNNLFSQTPK